MMRENTKLLRRCSSDFPLSPTTDETSDTNNMCRCNTKSTTIIPPERGIAEEGVSIAKSSLQMEDNRLGVIDQYHSTNVIYIFLPNPFKN